ncbi:4-(cytidine 5'-diphospho)-2-C-methyl-D-erythritol kinase [Moorella sulfitireducens (nom. illeg.)]|uniref:4-(cytidine 5'-diphospho)-2-C-methyl-D-erythritol kinase n=1 Tax=Neomoorella sulfitireducens TaxID=2972948 RepID=UPI0021AC11BE|nr:4-(cytidine 5'-diphospho)-2-C-methyl-D-erythritol kinase [Moorella sulfitireducens]
MDALKVRAYGKINLTLNVVGRRADGFHNISTIFQSIALQDTLILRRRSGGIKIEVKGATLPDGPGNLVYQAAILLQQRYGFPGVHISLIKRIPVAAGLGGGSSDAAATLVGLNYLYDLGLTPLQLAREGAELGSDVPFCVLGGTALGRGRGEELCLLPPSPGLWLVLVKPSFGVSTAAVYQRWDTAPYRQNPEPPDEGKAVAALKAGDREQLIEALGNDLEIVTCHLYPEVRDIKIKLLSAGAKRAVLCGSGPTVFGVAPDREKAFTIAARLQQDYPETIVTSTL